MHKKLGIIMCITGALVVGTAIFLHFSAENDLMSELSSRVMYTNDSSESANSSVEEDESSLLESPEFSPVDSDMVVDEITTFQNVLEVPSCDIQVPLIEGVDSAALRRGAGHFTETANIGEEGNACYAGHYSTIYNCIFNNLPNVKLYDEVIGYNAKGEKTTYYVISKYVTTPDNISVLAQYPDTKDLTIVTCSENGTRRLIIQCRALDKQALDEFRKESEREKRESLYALADEIGTINVTNFMVNKDRPVNMNYNLPARRHHERVSVVESLLDWQLERGNK